MPWLTVDLSGSTELMSQRILWRDKETTMHPHLEQIQTATRRHFLQQSTAGIGGAALAALLGDNVVAAPGLVDPLAARQPHFPCLLYTTPSPRD